MAGILSHSLDSRIQSLSSAQSPPRTPQTPSSSRSRLGLGSSKLVRKARESKYLGAGDSIDEQVSRFDQPEESRRDVTTVEEESSEEEEDQSWYQTHYPCGGMEAQPYARDLNYFLSYSNASLDWFVSALFLGLSIAAESILFASYTGIRSKPRHLKA